jgi:dihydroflavonol-4-reductase
MYYNSSEVVREWELSQTPVEILLEKAVKWFRMHGYA